MKTTASIFTVLLSTAVSAQKPTTGYAPVNGLKMYYEIHGSGSGEPLVLLHGSYMTISNNWTGWIGEFSKTRKVIAVEMQGDEVSTTVYASRQLPGFGESDVLPAVSFPAFGQAISELLDRLAIGPRYIYLHDFGAPVGFHIAMQAPERVWGLIVQNANAHRTGFGPQWAGTLANWSQPNPENEAAVMAHLTFEGRATSISPVSRRTWPRGSRPKAGRRTGG